MIFRPIAMKLSIVVELMIDKSIMHLAASRATDCVVHYWLSRHFTIVVFMFLLRLVDTFSIAVLIRKSSCCAFFSFCACLKHVATLNHLTIYSSYKLSRTTVGLDLTRTAVLQIHRWFNNYNIIVIFAGRSTSSPKLRELIPEDHLASEQRR